MSDDTNNDDSVPAFELVDGEVHSNGEAVARLEEGELKIKRGYGKHRAEIERVLDAGTGEDSGDGTDAPGDDPSAGDPPAPAQETAPVREVIRERDEKPEGVIEEGRHEARKYAADVQDDIDFARQNGIEPPPKKNPRFGDKTPAYVSWLKTHRPRKYAERYGIERHDERIPVFDESGEIVRHERMDVGKRKTHVSEKIERDSSLDESMDWEA